MAGFVDKEGHEVAADERHFLAAAEFVLMLRQKGVRDISVLRAMEQVARLPFLDEKNHIFADDDVMLPLKAGQTALNPSMVALMCEALQIERHHKVLCLGAGTGYLPALLSRLAREVIAVERVKSLAHVANLTLFKQGYDNVTLIYGDGFDGFISKSPYDRIICAFSLQEMPQNLLNQLKPTGFMIAPFEGRLTRFSETGIEPLKIICAIPKGRIGVNSNL